MSEGQTRDILAANLRRMIDKNGQSNRSWAISRGLDVKLIDRLVNKSHAVTLDKLEEIAKACGLEPWHLLIPDLEPGQRIDAPLTEADRELLNKLKNLLK